MKNTSLLDCILKTLWVWIKVMAIIAVTGFVIINIVIIVASFVVNFLTLNSVGVIVALILLVLFCIHVKFNYERLCK